MDTKTYDSPLTAYRAASRTIMMVASLPATPDKLARLCALELTSLSPADAYVVAHQLQALRTGLRAVGLAE